MKTGKVLMSILLLSTILIKAQGQSENVRIDSTSLNLQAAKMADALIIQDYQSFVKFTYPKIVKMAGGKEAMAETLEKSIQNMKGEGFTFSSCKIGSVMQVVKAGKELHALLPQHVVMKVKGGTLISNSYLIAISMDQGKNWYFVDTANLTDEKIRLIFPEYNYDLKIPSKQPPVFTKD